MSISAIEKKLLEKEIESFKAELEKGSLIIQEAFKKYYTDEHGLVGFKGQHREELSKFLGMAVSANEDYRAGHATNVKSYLYLVKFPQFLQDAMLNVASARFLESIEEIKEITDNLEG